MAASSCSRCGPQPQKSIQTTRRSSKRHVPMLILTLAIPGLLFAPFAVAAVVMGVRYRRRVEQGTLPDSQAARVGFVLGAAGVLVAIIEVAALLYLLPVLLGPSVAVNEAAATSVLEEIKDAQSRHFRLAGSYAVSIELLRERGFLDLHGHHGYRFTLNVNAEATEFEARAHPIEPRVTGVRYFYVDQSGVVRWSKNPDVNRTSPAFSPQKDKDRNVEAQR